MKVKGIIFSLALVVWSVTNSVANARETILWGIHDLPPLQITTGKYTHQGIYDGVLDFLQSKMPQYQHVKREANAKRFWKWLKEEEHFCYVASIPTAPRRKIAYYSMANGFHVANSVIMTKTTARSMGLTDSVSLKQLLINPKVSGGAVTARSYGRDLDQIINQHKQASFKTYVSGNLGQSVYQMLLGKRMDYIIEYSFVVEYFDKILDTGGQSTSLIITDVNPFTMGHTACPKNAWGRKIINQINAILAEHRSSEAYRQLMERWQSPAVKKRVRDNYQVFLNSKALD